MAKLFVRCCENNKVKSSVYFDEHPDSHCFRFTDSDDPCEYCPWCGILLDINLEMSPAWEE